MSKKVTSTNVKLATRDTANFKRSVILAKVEDWLSKRVGVKVLKIVNGAGGLAFVMNNSDQLKILFPSIKLSTTDPRRVFGLVLDREKGWVICSFNYSKDRPASSVLTGIIKEVGYDEDTHLLGILYRVFISAPSNQTVSDIVSVITLLVRLTRFAKGGV